MLVKIMIFLLLLMMGVVSSALIFKKIFDADMTPDGSAAFASGICGMIAAVVLGIFAILGNVL